MKNKMLAVSPVIEEAFIQIIAERIEARGISHKEFAESVWPDAPKTTAFGRWRDMRKYAYRTGKPMTVSLENALRMSAYFGEDICYLLVLAQEYAAQHDLMNSAGNAMKGLQAAMEGEAEKAGLKSDEGVVALVGSMRTRKKK